LCVQETVEALTSVLTVNTKRSDMGCILLETMYIPLLRTWYVHAHFDFPSGRGKLSSQKQVQKLSPSVHVPLRAIKIVHATHHKGLPDIPHAVHETDWASDAAHRTPASIQGNRY